MTKACYVGVDGVAKKVKKIYTGVSDVARKVKKAYVGIGGVARPFFSGDEKKLIYYGEVDYPTGYTAMYACAAGSVGNYAVFAGGFTGAGGSPNFSAYSSNLTGTFGCGGGEYSEYMASASLGDYLIFAGGYNYDKDRATAQTRAINTQLTFVGIDGTTNKAFQRPSAVVGDYAIFGPGPHDEGAYYDTNIYSKTLVKQTVSAGVGKYSSISGYNENVALFACGLFPSTTEVRSCNSSLVWSNVADVDTFISLGAGASAGDYILIGGGYTTDLTAATDTVNVYTSALVKGTSIKLSTARSGLCAITFKQHTVFSGGADQSSAQNTIDMFNPSLVRTMYSLSKTQFYASNAITGDYLLIGGGSQKYYDGMPYGSKGSSSGNLDVFTMS